jgi:hypothetical protein
LHADRDQKNPTRGIEVTDSLTPEKRIWWMIKVTGYGEFEHFGTEAEAEEMRVHKSQWEGGRGTKRKATPDEIAKMERPR